MDCINSSNSGLVVNLNLSRKKLNFETEGNPIHPSPTSLMPIPPIDAQTLERDCRSTGEHVKDSTKELQPVGQLLQGASLNDCANAQGIKKRCQRHAHTCRAQILLASNHTKLCSAGDTLEGRDASQGTERLERCTWRTS